MLRFVVAAPLALFLSLLLFYGLAMITSMADRNERVVQLDPILDFLMLRKESDIEVRQRRVPEVVQDIVEQQPEIPRFPMAHIANVDNQLSVEVPNISMEMDVSLSPSLHNLPMPAMTPFVDTSPVVLSRVLPRYPHRALLRKQEGEVVVEFTITERGTVQPDSIVVIESSPAGVFESAVLRAIKRWRFKARVVNGQPIAFRALQKLQFSLEK